MVTISPVIANTKPNFHRLIEEWIEHCKSPVIQLSSLIKPVRNCDAFREIVSMGYEALPLIRKVYDRDSSDNFGLSIVQEHGLVFVVSELMGDNFSIPEEIRGQISATKDYTKRWLDENIPKYMSPT